MLAGTLSWDGDFWAYAKAIERVAMTASEAAKLYVPRKSKPQDAICHLLSLASMNIDERFDRTGIRAGIGMWKVTTAAGPIAYFVEAENLKANAFSLAGMQVLDHGAMLVSRRGAGRCLECDARLPSTKRPSERGDAARTEFVNYCDECLPAIDAQIARADTNSNLPNILPQHFEAMRTVLDAASPHILAVTSS